MKKTTILLCCLLGYQKLFCWGFFAHQKINFYAVFLLPPEMMSLYKPNLVFITEHAVDPDKRRYSLAAEAPRHYIDIDHYGPYPFSTLPRKWDEAVSKFTEDSLLKFGIVPWWIVIMKQRLTKAFREKNQASILRLSAELGHYIADAHVPLHVCSNHNGQLTNQQGIHAFWESRIPELLADKEWDFFIGKADYLSHPSEFIWKRILESAAASDTVLRYEQELNRTFRDDQKYAFESRKGMITRQYSSSYSIAYNNKLNNMIERRMRASIYAVASFWYTAWVDAGQPDLKQLGNKSFTESELREFDSLDLHWKNGKTQGFDCDE
jgi:hypothetical protein